MSNALALCLLLGSACLVTCAGKPSFTAMNAGIYSMLAGCGRPLAHTLPVVFRQAALWLAGLCCYRIWQGCATQEVCPLVCRLFWEQGSQGQLLQ